MISVLIPSRDNPRTLSKNINSVLNIPANLHLIKFLILLDDNEQYQLYKKYINESTNVKFFIKNFEFQSDRYLFLLNQSNEDLNLIGSDDIQIKFTTEEDEIKKHFNSEKIYYSELENTQIINHPIIPRSKVSEELISNFKRFKFKKICVDTLISYIYSKNSQRSKLNIIINHKKLNKVITKKDYKIFIYDLFQFIKFFILYDYCLPLNLIKLKIILSVFVDFISALKNFLYHRIND